MTVYVPVLQTKRGEFSALTELQNNIKDHIKPMFVLTQDKCEERATSLARNLTSKWASRAVYIDLTKVNPFNIQNHYFTNFIFNDLAGNQIDFTPVIHVERPDHQVVLYVVRNKIKSCIKVDTQLFDQNTVQKLDQLLNILQQTSNTIDVIIDFGSNVKPTRQAHAQNIATHFFAVSNQFGSKISQIIIAGSSIPKDFPRDNYNPYGFEPRIEWLGFDDFLAPNAKTINHPIFADFGISYPDEQEPIDYVNPNAKIRYTLSDNYMFSVGYQVYTHTDGFEQYYDMSRTIVHSPYFLGAPFSWGSKYIDNCSNRTVSCGNMETWVRVGHNHHITFVTRQIASQYGISI